MATEIKSILNNAYSIRQIVTLSTLLSSWDAKNYGDKMKKQNYKYFLVFLLLLVVVSQSARSQTARESSAYTYLPEDSARKILSIHSDRQLSSSSTMYIFSTTGCRRVNIDAEYFERPYSSEYEISSDDTVRYISAQVSLKTSLSESEAEKILSTLNADLQEDITTKLQPYYTDFIPFPKAGAGAVLFTGYNTSTDRAKMLLRFRVKRFIMTIETSGLSKEFVLPKFAELYEIAKMNMEKY